MKSQGFKATDFSGAGGELSLSCPALVELIGAVLSKGAQFKFQAKGFSMSPFIRDGDVISVSPLNGFSPRFGDVVAFIHPDTNKLGIHRVVGKKGDSYLIRGDSGLEIDGLIPKSEILGYVTRVERCRKRVFIGLGPERLLIAFLTSRGIALPFWYPVWRFIRHIISRYLV